ncbi:MAG: maltose alpha-D-glucosyltransferase [Candidatus Omnitrophota bacterium]
MAKVKSQLENDPLWYKDAVIYQLHVKTFYDSDNDGIGDIKGLTCKLDYLKNLGVTAIWLLPFYPSPLRDDGYDIADYYSIHPQYGTLRDFKEFLREAHKHGLRVITELVINHTSDQHPWFQRARKAKPGSRHRDYYVWSETPEKYKDARIIFQDFEQSNWAWDDEAQAYYWHRFYSHQPDLNFDNPSVQREIFKIMDFWFAMGVDGLRLDAVPYLFEREGTNCENLPETYAFLKKLRRHIDSKFRNRMLLAEANQWPEDAVAYFGKGDECHMAFHFPLMPRMYMSLQMEDRFPIYDILDQTPAIPKSCQWAIFLRNHDELTLEMVTDEERDYMYRAYAKDVRSRINLGIRRRLLPLLGNNRRKVELMNIMLLSLPGTPIIYYGDEIGMGDNHFLGDRDGVRTPMQWSPDRNAGFSRANSQQLFLPVIIDSEYHYTAVNVETQDHNLSSMLWWMKRVIAMRKKFKAFSQGEIKFLLPENAKVLSFIRRHQDEHVLVVINLSRFSQPVALDLREYEGYVPEEVFSQNDFPVIQNTPYVLTLGAHNHFWFLLKKPRTLQRKSTKKMLRMNVDETWEEVLDAKHIKKLESHILPSFLVKSRWFGGKSKTIRQARVHETIFIQGREKRFYLLILQVSYTFGMAETYLLPLTFSDSAEDKLFLRHYEAGVICQLHVGENEGLLFDASYDKKFHAALFDLIARKRTIRSGEGQLIGYSGRMLKKLIDMKETELDSQVLKAEQSNTSIIYNDRLFLKLFRKLEEGVNPDVEIGQYLTEKKKFQSVPPYAGHIRYARPKQEPVYLSIIQGCVPNQSDAWQYTLDRVKTYYDAVLARVKESLPEEEQSKVEANQEAVKTLETYELIDGFYLDMVRLLGQRTGEMHLALAGASDDRDFKPESFTTLYQRSVYQAMGSQARYVMRLLKNNLAKLPVEMQGEAAPIVEVERKIMERFKTILRGKYSARTMRIHGDFHLGQVLFTGKDFVIIDFEGEPARPLTERRLKRSALRDIAGMIRSFHYAAYAALFLNTSMRYEDIAALEPAAEAWYDIVSRAFVESYYETIGKAGFLPRKKKELDDLLQIYLLDKAMYELGYELNNRPDWVVIPLRGIRNIIKQSEQQKKDRRRKSKR